MNGDSKLVLFADDTSVIITASNLNDLQTKAEHTLTQMNENCTNYDRIYI
jgi:hypothetical protein